MNGRIFGGEELWPAASGRDRAARAARIPIARAAGVAPAFWIASIHSNRRAAGISLVECLVATALTLTLLSILIATSSDILSAMNSAADRADQHLRLRQISRFLDRAMSQAGLPSSWNKEYSYMTGDVLAPILSDPCASPESAGYRSEWGGVALLGADSSCFPGSGHHTGLYIETVHPCTDGCGAGEGYVLFPAACERPEGSEAREPAWRAQWQSDLSELEGCAEAATWGLLQRMFLIYRKTNDAPDSLPALRVQTPIRGSDYRWGAAEVLIDGVSQWDLSYVAITTIKAARQDAHPRPEVRSLGAEVSLSPLRLAMTIASGSTPWNATPLKASMVLVWPALHLLR